MKTSNSLDADMDNSWTTTTTIDTPLLNNFVDGAVDYRGRQVLRSKSGFWRSAFFIIGVEVAERFAYYGVSSNLITYLTGPLGQSTATAAENVNAWIGTASLLPLVGGFIADAFLGRYLTIIYASLLYILALGLLALSTLLPSNRESTLASVASSCSSHLQVITFFVSLYLVAFAQGCHKPCALAFGADQFDANDRDECKAKSSFFNWWYFGMCTGPAVGIFILSYIQDNLSWSLGFGIPCIVMGFALIIFLLGTMTYRFPKKTEDKSVIVRIGQVFVEAARNWRATPLTVSLEDPACETFTHESSLRFLNKALLSRDESNESGTVCSISEVEEAKSILRLIPIWASCLSYSTVLSQTSTLFTKQGATMDRSIGSTFEIPAAMLQSFIGLSIIILIPIYDTMLVPLARSITKKPFGITMLQRIGTGIFISIVLMLVSALVETKRLNTAREYRILDDPTATIPMKIWWLLPQYLLAGAADIFAVVGMQEFFYDQVPSEVRSIGLAFYLSVSGVGNFLSSFIISIVQKTTSGNGKDGWISDNMNQGHVDYFYYLLAGISAGSFVIYICAAKSYVYNQGRALSCL